MEVLTRTISNLLDIRIDYYVLVDMAGFVDLIDAIGGVDIYFHRPWHIAFSAAEEGGEKAYINVDAGMNHLDGLEALAYVRSRYEANVYVRMHRQRCMLRSVASKVDLFTLVRRFSAISDAITTGARTNLPLELLPELVRLLTRLNLDEIDTVGFGPGYYSGFSYAATHQIRPVPNVARIQAKVQSILAGESSGVGGGSVESECN